MRSRIRTIKPEFWDSERVGSVAPIDRLLFIGLWSLSDDEGRLKANPVRIRKILFGYDDPGFLESVTAGLDSLQSAGLVQLYEVNGEPYAWIIGWSEHQKIDRPKASQLPPPPTHRDTSRHLATHRCGPGPGPGPGPGSGKDHSSPETPRVSRRKVFPPEHWSDQEAALTAMLPAGFKYYADQLAHLMASENKTGSVSTRRVVTQLLAPMVEWLKTDGVDLADAKRGLDAAINNGAPNINYAKKAAKPAPSRENVKKGVSVNPMDYDQVLADIKRRNQ